MTPETDPRQTPDPVLSAVTPGKGTRVPDIDLARQRREYAMDRHPSMRAVRPIPRQPIVRTLPDEDIERGARIVDMRDPNPAPRHREGGPVRKRDAARSAVRRFLGVTR